MKSLPWRQTAEHILRACQVSVRVSLVYAIRAVRHTITELRHSDAFTSGAAVLITGTAEPLVAEITAVRHSVANLFGGKTFTERTAPRGANRCRNIWYRNFRKKCYKSLSCVVRKDSTRARGSLLSPGGPITSTAS